ncbi:hypothetical protein A8A54_18715 [Brucella pseudogrignonensis]|nr:hypothetical protein A8A54_18715 [Brucella pseudogrignonensis]
MPHNLAIGVSIRTGSRYEDDVKIPTRQEIVALLAAADALANSKNLTIAGAWKRYPHAVPGSRLRNAATGIYRARSLCDPLSAIRETGIQVVRAIDGG